LLLDEYIKKLEEEDSNKEDDSDDEAPCPVPKARRARGALGLNKINNSVI
jgi:hypothetical protein